MRGYKAKYLFTFWGLDFRGLNLHCAATWTAVQILSLHILRVHGGWTVDSSLLTRLSPLAGYHYSIICWGYVVISSYYEDIEKVYNALKIKVQWLITISEFFGLTSKLVLDQARIQGGVGDVCPLETKESRCTLSLVDRYTLPFSKFKSHPAYADFHTSENFAHMYTNTCITKFFSLKMKWQGLVTTEVQGRCGEKYSKSRTLQTS